MDGTQTRVHECCMFECALVVQNEFENVTLFFVSDVCETKYFGKQPTKYKRKMLHWKTMAHKLFA